MPEDQPLLVQDPEDTDQDCNAEGQATARREVVANFLEKTLVHKVVIALIAVDATCVLADLSYTLLSQNCAPEDPEGPFWLEVFSDVSFAITTSFLVEIPLALWAFGFSYYNPLGDIPYALLHMCDALIIVTTFTLEILLKGRERELAGLLIVLRLWRLVKLVGGVAVGAGELGEEGAKRLAEIEKELHETRTALRTVCIENDGLKHRIAVLEGGDSNV
ncbi:hypothetical protein AX15_003925 [Amanita polypyramis BW_CC]|nr:hypothetical protein AX15_003925 [Amanita polypyramis BW_CC]